MNNRFESAYDEAIKYNAQGYDILYVENKLYEDDFCKEEIDYAIKKLKQSNKRGRKEDAKKLILFGFIALAVTFLFSYLLLDNWIGNGVYSTNMLYVIAFVLA